MQRSVQQLAAQLLQRFRSTHMTEVEGMLDALFLGNSLLRWIIAAGVIVGVYFALMLLHRLAQGRYRRLAATPQAEFLETPLQIASQTTVVFRVVASVTLAMLILELPERAGRALLTLFTIVAFWQLGLWATTAVRASLIRKRQFALEHDRAAASSLGIIDFLSKITIWSLVLLLTLDNLGIEIQPLLAGLGIGGIAVALAAQSILGDLFASLSIALDRPFLVGDSLTVDTFSGTVEYIGIKSTRLRGVDGEQIIIPNANLLGSRVRNNARLRERRVLYTISVDQQTPREQLQKIPRQLRALIESQHDVRFERAHFAKISATSFDFEAVYFVLTPDYGRHMDILQDVNLRLIEVLEKDGIEFAYPSQRLYMEPAPVQSQLVEGSAGAAQPSGSAS
jgi:small-conductance mechanosensitive channel